MTNEELINQNKILQIRVGSHLYSTNTEDSDEDYSGIFMPSEDYVFGFKSVEQIDQSVKVKQSNGKNSKEAVDCVYYEFRKFVKLAMENNPNVIEQLFVNEENIIFQNTIGKALLFIKHLFPWKGLYQKFLGYAKSQKHRMILKSDKFEELNKGLKLLDYEIEKLNHEKMLLSEFYALSNKDYISVFREGLDSAQNVRYIAVGDINLQPSYTLLKCKKIIEERLDKFSNRKELIKEVGYDYKYASHLIRLLFEGIELLETGKLEFPLSNRGVLLDIKNGKWNLLQVIEYAEDLEKLMEEAYLKSSLSSKPNYNLIEDFTIKTLKDFLNK